MAVLKVLTYPDSRLKAISQPVSVIDGTVRAFIADLEETMRSGPPSVGIAAPQVGRLEQIVIIDCSFKPKIKQHGRLVLINPEIVSEEGEVKGREGCLSVPDFTGNVMRPKKITLKARDEYDKEHTYDMEGFEARAALHEIDHLKGLLFLDRLVSRRHDLFPRKIYK